MTRSWRTALVLLLGAGAFVMHAVVVGAAPAWAHAALLGSDPQDGTLLEFEEFEVSAGPLPQVEQVAFKALQTYADGEVVRWIEERSDATPEPEKPAPVLTLAAAVVEGASASAQPIANVSASTAAPADDDGPSGVVAIVALVTGAAALAVGSSSLITGRRRA